MSNLAFACIAPHGSMIIPLLAGEEGQKALSTRGAMEELGRRMARHRPETVVLITPHGHRVEGCFSLLNNQRVRGELGPWQKEKEGENSLAVVLGVDKELNGAIVEAATALEVPVTRLGYAVADDPAYLQPLDWGATVPLWFLGALFYPQPRVVIACQDSHYIPHLETGRKVVETRSEMRVNARKFKGA
jgi:aromatic ring-opening dioxygenase LigB subunit